MGRLIIFILVAAGLWMGYWAFGSITLERALKDWIEQRRSEGWVAEVSDLNVSGFPNRFDTTLTDIVLADPETGVAWRAPFFQLLALSYRPNQVIAVLPPEHTLSTPLQTMTVTSDQTRGSVYLGAETTLPLESATFIADQLAVVSNAGWRVNLDQARFAIELAPVQADTYRIGAELTALDLPESWDRALSPGGLLPSEVETLRLDAEIGFTDPLDRRVIEVARPQITDIDLRDLSLTWGDVVFQATGSLTVDALGQPDGEVDIRAVQWQRLLDMAVASGVLNPGLAPTIERGLNLLAGLSGRDDTLDAPLTFRNGRVSLGPIPLGPAPRIILR